MWSTTCQGLVAQMPHTKFHSNRTDSSGEDTVLVSVAKIEGCPLSPPNRGQSPCRAQLNIQTCSRSPILISVHSAEQFLTRRFLKKMPDLRVIRPPSPFGGANPDGEHNMTSTHCPDASHQIWFESAKYFWRGFCKMLTQYSGWPDNGNHFISEGYPKK